jgi:hypothetical protein
MILVAAKFDLCQDIRGNGDHQCALVTGTSCHAGFGPSVTIDFRIISHQHHIFYRSLVVVSQLLFQIFGTASIHRSSQSSITSRRPLLTCTLWVAVRVYRKARLAGQGNHHVSKTSPFWQANRHLMYQKAYRHSHHRSWQR